MRFQISYEDHSGLRSGGKVVVRWLFCEDEGTMRDIVQRLRQYADVQNVDPLDRRPQQ
jgi:hypothetical protein